METLVQGPMEDLQGAQTRRLASQGMQALMRPSCGAAFLLAAISVTQEGTLRPRNRLWFRGCGSDRGFSPREAAREVDADLSPIGAHRRRADLVGYSHAERLNGDSSA